MESVAFHSVNCICDSCAIFLIKKELKKSVPDL